MNLAPPDAVYVECASCACVMESDGSHVAHPLCPECTPADEEPRPLLAFVEDMQRAAIQSPFACPGVVQS